MRILLVHNHYTQPGGEDALFEAEKVQLERTGHEVIPFVEDNARLAEMNPLKAALNAVWSRGTHEKLRRLIREAKPDVAHFHNTFLMISPAAYYACKEEGVPVVQTLHNYRLVCPGALLMRDGQVCEDCVGKAIPWPGVLHGCWRDSRAGTAVAAAMLSTHRAMGTWSEAVDVYVALTEFARRKLIEGGLPAEKIVIKPNFVHPDPRMGRHEGDYALFVGRLSREKGLLTLMEAWRSLPKIPLKIVGDGPLTEAARRIVADAELRNVDLLGRRCREEVFNLMKDARLLLFPSECYENFPMTIVEAFACGLPVLASRLGAMAENVEDGRTGLHFEPGSPHDLAAKVEWIWTRLRRLGEMGREARKVFEQKYTAERNYRLLMDIYQRASRTR